MFRTMTRTILLVAALASNAIGANINGTQQQDFSCPSANCTTACAGPGGPMSITGYKDLSAWMIGQPERLWLQKTDNQNNVSVIVLGVGDRCTFGGTPLTISSPIQVSPLGPNPPPQCTCVGTNCFPPGCAQTSSPLR
jgi:hypothetical protein